MGTVRSCSHDDVDVRSIARGYAKRVGIGYH